MKKLFFILFSLFFSGGCLYENSENDTPFLGGEPAFTITQILAEGKNITALEVADENNFCYSAGNTLYMVSGGTGTSVELSSDVTSIARNTKDNSVWAGTNSSGLACVKNGIIRYYNQQNDQLPRNLVRDVLCDSEGRIWFNCSAHKLGGLGVLSENTIEFFTPSNSALPDNLIKSTAIRNGKIYVATGGTVTQQKVVVFDEEGWKTLPIDGYYLMDMDVDPEGKVYVIDDTGLSSSMITNKIWVLDQGGCRDILKQTNRFESTPYIIKTDLRNYLWVVQFTQDMNRTLFLYDGDSWHRAPEEFPKVYIKCLSVDRNNNLWMGTEQGIFVLDQ